MASPARHLFLVALVVAVLAVTAEAWVGGRFFFSKTARAEPAVEPEKAAAAGGSTTPDAADPNAAPAFSRPSTGGSGRGYGLYGRPEENYPPNYFRRGVHRNAEKLTAAAAAATDVPAATRTTEEAAGGGRGERAQQYPEDGSGRGRPPTNVPATASYTEEEAAPARGAGDLDGVQPYTEDGSGRGRPRWYYTAFRGGRRQQGQGDQQRDYGMSDTRVYQNGRYYYDVDAGRYGYGRESNTMRTRPEAEEEFAGSGYGRPGGGRRGGYGNAAAGYPQYGNDDEFKNPNGFKEEGRNGRYIP
ncbi:translation initiation factor IF-2-like [Panicum miliaceum]|uniref:Translation initiation factor IF-2-like n=1 Tax=Panicum miliaceum TaxID=4540 RepID=A0A3L6SH16_PANMI|nr:translation initiation factor IF-2-like [Panicum miliaceum]